VDVKDDCGKPLTTGGVVVSFSNGDPPVSMQSLKDGRWAGTWQSRSSRQAELVVKANAREPLQNLQGSREIKADLRAAQNPPVVGPESVVSAASPLPHVPISPGSMIAIYGERLAEREEVAQSLPLPDRLGETQVLMAGRPVPLLYAGQNQINAI